MRNDILSNGDAAEYWLVVTKSAPRVGKKTMGPYTTQLIAYEFRTILEPLFLECEFKVSSNPE